MEKVSHNRRRRSLSVEKLFVKGLGQSVCVQRMVHAEERGVLERCREFEGKVGLADFGLAARNESAVGPKPAATWCVTATSGCRSARRPRVRIAAGVD